MEELKNAEPTPERVDFDGLSVSDAELENLNDPEEDVTDDSSKESETAEDQNSEEEDSGDDSGEDQLDGEDESDEGESEEKDGDEKTPDEVEINGEKITLEELKNGYLRQKDYTQKTQELATLRKSLSGLDKILGIIKKDSDVIDALRDYWVEQGNEAKDFDDAINHELGKNPYEEEYEGMLSELKTQNAQLEAEISLAKEIQDLKSSFKGITDSDIEEIAAYSVDHNEKTGTLLTLVEAYKLMNFDKIRESKKAPPKTPKLSRGARDLKKKAAIPTDFEEIEIGDDIFD